jgi:hypothetical protein
MSVLICIDDPTSAHSKGIGRQSEFSNRELAEKKFELVYGAATNDWSPRINSVNNILVINTYYLSWIVRFCFSVNCF